MALALMVAPAVTAHAQTATPTYLPVTTADFNHDGIPDLLIQPVQTTSTSGVTAPTATIAFGSVPYGTFSSNTKAVTFPSACVNFNNDASAFGDLLIGDFNGDTLPDLFFSCYTNASNTTAIQGVMPGNGDGTFGTPILLALPNGFSPANFLVADFNYDGKLDVVAISNNNALSTNPTELTFFAGNGDGTFAAPVSTTLSATFNYANGGYPPIQGIIASDVNGDGYTDLVATTLRSGQTTGSNNLVVFGNNKDGTFGVPSQGTAAANVTYALGNYPSVNSFAVHSGNVFGTGKPDLLLADGGSAAPGLFVLQNTSTATTYSFASPVKIPNAQAGTLLVGNFTGTSFTDVTFLTAAAATVLANDGTGNYTNAYSNLSFPETAPRKPDLFAVADANGDGYADIYTATTDASGALQVSVNLVTGTATATSQSFPLGIGTRPISATWPGNVNFTGSTATGTQVVIGVPSAASIISSKNPSLVGDAVTFTVTVAAGAASAVIPTGTLVLKDNGSTLTTGPLDFNGKLTYATSTLTQGPHTITAIYAGDTYFAGVTSAALSQVVNRPAAAPPTLTWATPAAIVYGTPLSGTQLNAVATDANGVNIPGVFTYTPATGTILNAGPQPLRVDFTPTDALSFLTATKSVPLNVLQATPGVSVLLTSGGTAVNTLATGNAIKLTATVNAAGAALTMGQVNFCDALAASCTDVHLLGTSQLTSAGIASLSVVPAIGKHSYKAVFLGTKNTAAGSSQQSALTVTGRYATTTTVAQRGTVGNYTLTASTIGLGSSVLAPGGLVSFLDQSNNNLSLASAPLGTSSYSFRLLQSSSPSTGREPEFIATGDFNGDGKPDLAIANYGTVGQPATGRTLTILLGNGDGTFTTVPSPQTGNVPTTIAAGDFNGDGKTDLAVTNAGDNTITVLLGRGDGTFETGATLSTGSSPSGIATGDFNGDGNADLVTANQVSNTLTILLGNGDGTFTVSTSTPSTGAGPHTVAVGDFNRDGRPDLAVASTGTNGLTILLGNGDGSFTPSGGTGAADVVGGNFAVAAVGDFNGDGLQDIVVAGGRGGSDGSLLGGNVLIGKGDGTFTNASGLGSDPTYSFSLAVRDIDGDGKSDIVVADDHGVTVLQSNGDGTFTPLVNVFAGGDSQPDYVSLVLADLNGDGIPDIVTGNSDADAVTTYLSQETQTATATATGVSPLGPGTHAVVASYAGAAAYAASVSGSTLLTGVQVAPKLTWAPAVNSIVYGTPLGPQQLNAIVTGPDDAVVNGVYTYLPAAGTLLTAGLQTLTVSFAPSDPTFIPVSGKVSITVTPATPAVTWPAPSSIAYGTPLGGSQLNATATGVTGGVLPGTFTYTPAAGTVLTPGSQVLTVRFVPADVTDYTVVTATTKLLVTGVTLSSITPATAVFGDGDKSVTLVGSGFVSNSIAQVNGVGVATTLVNPTTLTAVIPAANFAKVGTLQIVVVDPSVSLASAALTITVAASTPSVTLAGPTTTAPGSQPALSFSINNPYPVALTAAFNLGFAPSVTPAVDDQAIQFANGSRTYTFVIPANSTAVPPILLQSGTVAGTITIPLTLTANGTNVTPTTLRPVVIVIPAAVPTVSTTTLTRNGQQLSVTIHGFSNTREVTQATFHFVGIDGAQIDTPDITAPVGPLFTGWYSSTQSAQFGSTFTYTQVFNVSDNAANIGSVQVTLTNTIGVSVSQSAQ